MPKPHRIFLQPVIWRVLVIVWAAVLYWLSSKSGDSLPPGPFSGFDKIEHAGYFAGGGMCFLLSLRLAGFARGKALAICLTMIFCATVGILDEWHQTFTPGRSGADVWDWLADTVGGFIGAHAAFWAERWLTTKKISA